MLLASNQRQSDSQTLSIADRTKTLADHCPLKWIPSRNSRFPLEPTECPPPLSSCSARYHLSSSLIGTINVGEVVLSIGANDCCAARFWRMKIFEMGVLEKCRFGSFVSLSFVFKRIFPFWRKGIRISSFFSFNLV